MLSADLHATQGKQLAQELIDKVVQLNRRTMDQLSSKIYFYWVRLHELNGDDTAALRRCDRVLTLALLAFSLTM